MIPWVSCQNLPWEQSWNNSQFAEKFQWWFGELPVQHGLRTEGCLFQIFISIRIGTMIPHERFFPEGGWSHTNQKVMILGSGLRLARNPVMDRKDEHLGYISSKPSWQHTFWYENYEDDQQFLCVHCNHKDNRYPDTASLVGMAFVCALSQRALWDSRWASDLLVSVMVRCFG